MDVGCKVGERIITVRGESRRNGTVMGLGGGQMHRANNVIVGRNCGDSFD